MDKLNKYDLTKFSVSSIYDNKNEGLLHKDNRLLLVSAIIYIPFFSYLCDFSFHYLSRVSYQQLTNNISLLRKI